MCPRNEDRRNSTGTNQREASGPQAVGDLLGGVLAAAISGRGLPEGETAQRLIALLGSLDEGGLSMG